MNATETSTLQYLSYDHPFNAALVVALGILATTVLLWTLYRERHVLGAKTTWSFGLLRVVAIATAFWMLLAPTNVLEESTSTRKAVLMVTDVSASMTIVDPTGTADDLRWASLDQESSHFELADGEAAATTVALCDQAIAALGIAERNLVAAIDDLAAHGAQRLVTEHIVVSSEAIGRAQGHLQRIREHAAGAATTNFAPPDASDMLSRLSRLLESPEYDALIDLADTLRRGRTPDEAGWREGIPDLIGRTQTSRRVLEQLAESWVAAAGAENQKASISKRFQSKSRSQRLASFLEHFQKTQAAAIEGSADLHWISFDASTRRFSGDESAASLLNELVDRDDVGKQTDLASALEWVGQFQQDQPVAAAFVLSDVAHNHDGDRKPVEIAGNLRSLPVYMVPIGNESRRRDIDLISVSAPAVAMRNDDVVIEANLGIYQCLGESCTVQLLSDGEVIDFRNVLIDSDSESRSVRFEQRVSEVGLASFQIAVQPLDGEMSIENNFDEIEINVTRSDIKVLLADELPRWEYRYLAQLFRRDPKVEVDELLFHPRVIATGRREESKTFPITVDQWDQYDVVILGDLPVEHFPVAAQESLLQYLRQRSGTLIMIAGDAAMPHAYQDHPIQEIVPVKPIAGETGSNSNVLGGALGSDQFAFRVTEAGRSHVALMIGETEQTTREAWDFVNRFSPLHHVSRWRVPLPTARSLIAAVPRNASPSEIDAALAESSFLCWQPVGRGRVVYLSGPDTYRLRFLRGDRLHYRFWGQLMRWAIAADLSSGNRMVRIRTGRTLYQSDEPVDVSVELLDSNGDGVVWDDTDSETLSLRLASGERERLIPLTADEQRPGHFQASVRELEPGVYRAQPTGSLIERLMTEDAVVGETQRDDAVATFTVQADLPSELVDTRCNRVLAEQISELTGGQVLKPTAVEEVLQLTDLEPVVTHRIQRKPLWLRWRYLVLVFGCLQTEWIIRKWRGLS